MNLNTIIFDADHTLYTPNSEKAYESKFAFLAEETGATIADLQREWEKVTKRAEQSKKPGAWERKQRITETVTGVGATPDEDLINDAYSVFWETVANNTISPDGIARMLRSLRSAGYNLAIATDEFPEPLRIKLAAVLGTKDVDSFFEMIVTPMDVGKQKPSEKFYTLILEELGTLADEAMMVGDSWVRDLQPAQKMGMTTVLVGTSEPKGTPDYEIGKVTELEDIVAKVSK